MYGKKRVVINNRGQIVIAGKEVGSQGGSWVPVGVAIKREGSVEAKFLSPDNKWDRKLTDENSVKVSLHTIKDVRNRVKLIYGIE